MSQHIRHYSMYIIGSLVGIAMFVATSVGVPMIFAQVSNTAPSSITAPTSPINTVDQSCVDAMPAIFTSEQKKFIDFMNDHFKNAAPNSSLLQTGLDRLNNYRSTLITARNSFALTSKYQSDASSESSFCDQKVRDQILIAEKTFQSFVEETAFAKKSTALTEKLSGINGKLRTLNELLIQLDGYFYAFDKALPGFTQKCVKKDGSTTS